MIGKTIKLLRISKGLKQSDLAERIKVSTNYISLIENDKREPSLSFLKELASSLDIPVGLLFLELDMSKKEVSPQERDLLMKMRDLIVQIEMVRLQKTIS
ncbi:MAG: helix-turn-helix transcriptional regulator [Chloroflexi bacterium]|nr:helix-turn-helix transcriptional regulator [Chloroflexota bacterium]